MKIGIIGAGNIATHHARAYRALNLEIVAVADINQEAFTSRRAAFGEAAVYYPTASALLEQAEVDAVSICLGTGLHFKIARQAIAAGKHIFCEKTMTDSEAHSAELAELVRGYSKNFQVGYMKRFFPATQRAMELLPELGEIFSVYIRSYQGWERTSSLYTDERWKARPDGGPSWTRSYACGGMLNMGGSHMLDLMNLFVGEPASVYAQNWQPPDYDAETNSHALLRMRNGCVVHLEAANSPYSRNGFFRDGWDECIELRGKEGWMQIFYVTWDAPLRNAPVILFYAEKEKGCREYTFKKVDAFQAQMEHFAECCQQGVKSVPGAAEGYYVDRVIDACYRSAATGQAVALS